MNDNQEKIELLELQEKLIGLFFLCLIISFFINRNSHLTETNQKPMWSSEEARTISIIKKIIILGAILGEIYLVFKDREIILKKEFSQNEINVNNMEIVIAVGALILSLLGLYAIIITDRDIALTENPEL